MSIGRLVRALVIVLAVLAASSLGVLLQYGAARLGVLLPLFPPIAALTMIVTGVSLDLLGAPRYLLYGALLTLVALIGWNHWFVSLAIGLAFIAVVGFVLAFRALPAPPRREPQDEGAKILPFGPGGTLPKGWD